MSGSSFRLTVFYTVLAAVVVAAFVIVFHAGSGKTAQPAIAGGYDVSAGGACLGKAFDLQQSGQYVNLGVSQQDAPKAKLRFRHGVLEGDVACLGGGSRSFKASVKDGDLKGLAGRVPIAAALKRDPPPPGAPTLIPASVGSTYNVIPRSPCLGSLLTMDQHGSAVTLTLKKGQVSHLRYAAGKLTGTVLCADGTSQQLAGNALDRRITITLTPAAGAPPPSTLVVERKRDFTAGVAIFFLAIAIVMLARPLGRVGDGPHRSAARDGRGRRRHRAGPDPPRGDAPRTSRRCCSPATSSRSSAWRPTSA